jgi:hypothetical protein
VQNARGAKKRVLGGNPDVHLYVIGAMPAGNVGKAPIVLYITFRTSKVDVI